MLLCEKLSKDFKTFRHLPVPLFWVSSTGGERKRAFLRPPKPPLFAAILKAKGAHGQSISQPLQVNYSQALGAFLENLTQLTLQRNKETNFAKIISSYDKKAMDVNLNYRFI